MWFTYSQYTTILILKFISEMANKRAKKREKTTYFNVLLIQNAKNHKISFHTRNEQ